MKATSIDATFALVPDDVTAGDYAQVGPAGAVYYVHAVEHGPAHPREAFTTQTRVELEAVDAHDVPWAAKVHVLVIDREGE